MPTTRAQLNRNTALSLEQIKQRRTASLHITELTRPVLELILIPSTSSQDKKALRRTCKLFRRILDDNIVCLLLKDWDVDGIDKIKCLQKILKRAQGLHSLEEVVLWSRYSASSLIKHLPEHLTNLVIQTVGLTLNLWRLRNLPHLKSLTVVALDKVTGFQYLTGLTSLQCCQYGDIKSLAHLAPTLKQLAVHSCGQVQDMHQLTNLEVLQMRFSELSADFFQKHSQLPLKHLLVHHSFLNNAAEWQSAPTTLTRLTLYCPYRSSQEVLPPHIIHLQLVEPCLQVIAAAPAALPGLKILEICLELTLQTYVQALESLSLFNNLQSVGMCIAKCGDADADVSCHRQQILSAFASVARAVEKGVHLTVYAHENDMLGVFIEPVYAKSKWSTRYEI